MAIHLYADLSSVGRAQDYNWFKLILRSPVQTRQVGLLFGCLSYPRSWPCPTLTSVYLWLSHTTWTTQFTLGPISYHSDHSATWTYYILIWTIHLCISFRLGHLVTPLNYLPPLVLGLSLESSAYAIWTLGYCPPFIHLQILYPTAAWTSFIPGCIAFPGCIAIGLWALVLQYVNHTL